MLVTCERMISVTKGAVSVRVVPPESPERCVQRLSFDRGGMQTHHTVGPAPRLRNPHHGLVGGRVVETQRDFADVERVLEQGHRRVVVSALVHHLRDRQGRRVVDQGVQWWRRAADEHLPHPAYGVRRVRMVATQRSFVNL